MAALHQLNFDYLLEGPLPYVWLAIGGIVLLLVVDKFFDLKRLIKAVLRKVDPRHKQSAPAEQPPSNFNFHHLKTNMDDLKAEQKLLMERLHSVQKEVRNIQVDLDKLKRIKEPQSDHVRRGKHKMYADQHSEPSHDSRNASGDSYLHFATEQELQSGSDITALYNASRTDQSSRAKFREKYKPFCINVANDVDRRRNASLPADFRKDDDGSYLAVSQEIDEAVVFPNFTLVVVDAVYGPGALGEVFECGTFDSGCSYPNIRVATPATFKLTGGQSWRVTQKGKLELGQGQDD